MCSKCYYHYYSIYPKYECIYYTLERHWISANIEHYFCVFCTSIYIYIYVCWYIHKIKIIESGAMHGVGMHGMHGVGISYIPAVVTITWLQSHLHNHHNWKKMAIVWLAYRE